MLLPINLQVSFFESKLKVYNYLLCLLYLALLLSFFVVNIVLFFLLFEVIIICMFLLLYAFILSYYRLLTASCWTALMVSDTTSRLHLILPLCTGREAFVPLPSSWWLITMLHATSCFCFLLHDAGCRLLFDSPCPSSAPSMLLLGLCRGCFHFNIVTCHCGLSFRLFDVAISSPCFSLILSALIGHLPLRYLLCWSICYLACLNSSIGLRHVTLSGMLNPFHSFRQITLRACSS